MTSRERGAVLRELLEEQAAKAMVESDVRTRVLRELSSRRQHSTGWLAVMDAVGRIQSKTARAATGAVVLTAVLFAALVIVAQPWDDSLLGVAGWTPEPGTALDPALEAVADASCGSVDRSNPSEKPQLPRILIDQRGDLALAYYGDERETTYCFFQRDSAGDGAWGRRGGGGGLSNTDSGPPRDGLPFKVNGGGFSSAEHQFLSIPLPGRPPLSNIRGKVRDDVAKIVVHPGNDPPFTAVINGNIFIAWWPGAMSSRSNLLAEWTDWLTGTVRDDNVLIRAYDADGRLIGLQNGIHGREDGRGGYDLGSPVEVEQTEEN